MKETGFRPHHRTRPGARAGPTDGRPIGFSPTTLITLRWIAVAGQFVTLMIVVFALNFPVSLLPCLLVIGALAASNLALVASRPRRLTEARTVLILGFDLLQLASLIGFTGGLQNPFALLLLAPVTVSATILSRRATLGLTALAVAVATVIAFVHLPLPWISPEGVSLPLVYRLGIWTALTMSLVFIATYVWTASEESRRLTDALSASDGALAREREMSALGTLAAAAAHELGSPLATIAVVSKELLSMVDKDSPIYEDVELLKSQSDRCRDILVGLSRRPAEAGGDPFEVLPLSDLVEIASDEHVPDQIDLDVKIEEACDGPEPLVQRTPEFLHGLGNFVSNAGQFARHRVTIGLYWTKKEVWITVHDDGPGFANAVLPVLGEPYMSTRADKDGHMGLGVFIGTTLLERIGAEVVFRNRRGAEILVRWPRRVLEAAPDAL